MQPANHLHMNPQARKTKQHSIHGVFAKKLMCVKLTPLKHKKSQHITTPPRTLDPPIHHDINTDQPKCTLADPQKMLDPSIQGSLPYEGVTHGGTSHNTHSNPNGNMPSHAPPRQ